MVSIICDFIKAAILVFKMQSLKESYDDPTGEGYIPPQVTNHQD